MGKKTDYRPEIDWKLTFAIAVFFLSAALLYWFAYAGPRSEVLHQLAECMGEKNDYSKASYDQCVQLLRP